jgi:hypothetical protein
MWQHSYQLPISRYAYKFDITYEHVPLYRIPPSTSPLWQEFLSSSVLSSVRTVIVIRIPNLAIFSP